MAVEFGVIDHLDRQNVPVHETYDSRLRLMELYDRAGFSTFHITEHHFTPLGLAPSPLIFLSAAARITRNIRFAPLVLILPLYNPLRLASELCMLDHLTKGRLDIGAGRGISPYELAFHNINHLEAPAIYSRSVRGADDGAHARHGRFSRTLFQLFQRADRDAALSDAASSALVRYNIRGERGADRQPQS